jgi:TPR repeat protein
MARIFGMLIAVFFLSVAHAASAQSPEYSSELLNRALDGDADAQVSLGDAYFYGRKVRQDYIEAVKWWQMAAEQGDETARQLAEECVRKEYKDC